MADTATYTVTTRDTENAAQYSSFLLAHQITATSDDEGVCMISKNWGTVCLLKNSSTLDTYRVNTAGWDTAVAAFSTAQSDIVTVMKA